MSVQPLQPPPERLRSDLTVSEEREVGAIVADMWENGEKLLRTEVALGLAELQVRANKLKKSLVDGALTGAVYNAGMLVLLASAVLGLSEVMAPWLAALIVGLAALASGYALQKRAAEQAERAVGDLENPRTQRTIEAMKEGVP